jgi:hypothetical protein
MNEQCAILDRQEQIQIRMLEFERQRCRWRDHPAFVYAKFHCHPRRFGETIVTLLSDAHK